MLTRFWKVLLTAASAQDVAAVLPVDQVPGAQETTVYVVFGAGTSAGTVVIEAAHDPAYTGTWSNIGTIAWVAASRAHHLSVTGCHRAVRARISVAIVGGTVDAYAIAN